MIRRVIAAACIFFASSVAIGQTTNKPNGDVPVASVPASCTQGPLIHIISTGAHYQCNVGTNTYSLISGGGGSGTVTSVAVTVPAFWTISGTPITTSGTFAFNLAAQSGRKFLASPSDGSSGAPSMRAIVAADIPTLNQNTSGTASALAANGTNCSAGQIPLGIDASGNAEGCYTPTSTTVGLGSVTNDAQTKAAIVPNSAPSAGQVLIGNAGGTAYAAGSLSGDATLASTGVLTLKSTGTAGTFGDATHTLTVTTDAQGRLSSVSTNAITAGAACSTCSSNVLQKGNGANTLQDSAISESSGTVSTSAGTALALQATAPAQTSASQAGKNVTLTPSNAVDGSSTHAAASGGYLVLNAGSTVNSGNAGQVQVIASGSSSVPALCIGATAGNLCQTGFYSGGISNGIGIAAGGGSRAIIDGSVRLASTGQLSFASDSNPANADTRLSRCGVKCWQFGDGNDTATPQNYLLRGMIATGTNTAGSDVTVSPGAGTGSGASGSYDIQTTFPLGSGTTGQSFADRVYIRGNPKTLTESSATGIADIAVASGTVTGGTLLYTIEANDGTDFQVLRGQVTFSAVNKGGTLTSTGGTPSEITSVSTGTLTNTFTVTTGTNKITLNLNAVSSLTQTTLRATWQVRIDGGMGVVSPL